MVKFVDLFSGIGGFHVAANQASLSDIKLEFAGACEIDTVCRNAYSSAFDISSHPFPSDICSIANRQHPDKVDFGKFDFLFAGFPCQPFSNVGKRKALSDPRGNLFFEITRLLKVYRPKYFILENVQKIITLNRGAVLTQMTVSLEKVGYKVVVWDLRAEHFGLPQQRRRIFICGQLKSRSFNRRLPSPPTSTSLENAMYPTAWHLLERIMPVKHMVPIGSRRTIFTPNPKWMGNLDINRLVARPLCASMGKWHRANQDNYYTEDFIFSKNYRSKRPPVDLLRDPVRRITLLEGLRLQGFPDSFYIESGINKLPPTTAFRLIGNAVPVPLASSVIKQFLEGCL
jgi:DNA (cytosine-5)-methyltransferase 1